LTEELCRIDVRGPLELTVQIGAGDVEAAMLPKAGVDRLPDGAGGAIDRFEVVIGGWRFEVSVEPARHAVLRERAARAAAEHRPLTGTIRAQIPGRVTRVWVSAGDAVEQGARLLAIEAMKMENEVRAPHAGRVEALHVEVGDKVERDNDLVTLG
jgi:biotin carboxyl carrier protein